MMEVYRTPSKDVQEIILANVTYEAVIDGLNGYFASEPRNDYITVKMESDKQDFALYEAEAWSDILISWLRTKHGIFYYPGMEAKYAKMERIPPFTERMMDEGAYNSLKALHKRVTGDEAGTNSHTLIADGIKYFVNGKEREIKKLKDRIAELESSCAELTTKLATRWTKTSLINWLQQRARNKGVELDDAFLYSDDTQYDWMDIVDFLFDEIVKMKKEIEHLTEANCKDIMDYIRQESSRNGFELPEEIDGEPLTIKRVFHDLLELMRQYQTRIKKDLRDIYSALGRYDLYDDVDDFLIAVKARAEYVERLSRNAERETRKAVNEQLKKDTDYVADVLSTVLEALGISKSNTVHLDIFGLKTKAIKRASLIKSEHDRYLEQLEKAAADYQALDEEYQKLKSAEKSDVNALIREYCTEHGIVAPSRYLSDEACIEYLFSVSVAILQDLYRDIFKRQPDGLSAKDIATKILDRMLTTEDLYARCRTRVDSLETGIKSIFDKYKTKFTIDDYVLNGDPTSGFMLDCIGAWLDSPAFESRGKIRAEIENYKLSLKDYILKDIKKHGYRYDGLETKSVEEIVDWIIQIETYPRDAWAEDEIENLRSQIDRLKGLINAMNEEVKDM